MRKISIIFVFFLISATFVSAQEVLVGISENAVLKQQQIIQSQAKSANTQDTLVLPFLDDFSTLSVYPDQNLWVDEDAFINNGFAKDPYSAGVATMDAIDADGNVYQDANLSLFTGDFLTSKPIRLDSVFHGTSPGALDADDNVYLSFLYQPGGYGNYPEMSDSLVLELYAGIDSSLVIDSIVSNGDTIPVYAEKWNSIWSAPGIANDTNSTAIDSGFKYVSIHIQDSIYFKKDFRFGFKNYVSIDNSVPSWLSNADQWNIDYVYLDYNRAGEEDFYINDISFAGKAPGFLKNYTQMPWLHYRYGYKNELKETIQLQIANLDDAVHDISLTYFVFYKGDTVGYYTPSSQSTNINPYNTSGYLNEPQFSNPPVNYDFRESAEDSALFRIKYVLDYDDLIPGNNSFVYKQHFKNYFAYDDGTAEAGYGLTPSGSKLAYRFKMNTEDTLQAIDIYFNKTLNEANAKEFFLVIWKEELTDENIIYYQEYLYPQFTDGLNKFSRYHLSDEFFTDPQNKTLDGIFYVGMIQTTDDMLNIGYDMNNDAGKYTFYNADGTWEQSMFNGALMIRPVVGKPLPGNSPKQQPNYPSLGKLKVVPNPVQGDHLHIEFEKFNPTVDYSKTVTVRIYNSTGTIAIETPYKEQINVSSLKPGMYFIHVLQQGKSKQFQGKFIKAY